MTGQIIRIIDVSGKNVTFFVADKQMTFEWPAAALPQIGEVYKATLAPEFSVHEKLAAPAHDVYWPESDAHRWRKPTASGTNRMSVLKQRHLIKRSIRDYLHEHDFLEIDMPLLVRGTTPDAHVDTFAVDDRYLVTSCEYQIKRMEIGGFDRCYTLTQNYRFGDRSALHNPEFTMLEWARVGQSLREVESDVEQFMLRAYKAIGGGTILHYQGHVIDLTPPWDRMSVRAAIEKHIGVMLPDFSAASLLKAAQAANLDIKPDWEDDAIFLFSLVLEHIQPVLGFEKPVFLTEWPVLMTASAGLDESGKFTQRSELFVAGLELSDGFPSLTDYQVQRDAFAQQVARRAEQNYQSVTLDEKFVASVAEGFPTGAGMALGLDRLVMVLTDQARIGDVLAFKWEEL